MKEYLQWGQQFGIYIHLCMYVYIYMCVCVCVCVRVCMYMQNSTLVPRKEEKNIFIRHPNISFHIKKHMGIN